MASTQLKEKLDYDRMREMALEHKPRLIIGGFSSYPFAADWAAYREIADEVGAYLLADVAHVAGLIAAGVYPNPVGIADVVSFTTHKTLNGLAALCLSPIGVISPLSSIALYSPASKADRTSTPWPVWLSPCA